MINFSKAPNYGVNPELAVVTGASVQAGVIGGAWPLQVCLNSAIYFRTGRNTKLAA